MSVTNFDLVAYAKKALQTKTIYMWGGIMRPVTEAYIRQLAVHYPAHYSAGRQQQLRAQIGQGCYGEDCVGLIKSCYWGGVDSPHYQESTDLNTNGMMEAATEHGPIATLPELPGLCVWMPGHIGVYAGGGEVIEATESKRGDGVVSSRLSGTVNDAGWTHWLKCPMIDYRETEEQAMNRYQTIEEVPAWGRDTVETLLQKDALQGNESGLDLSEDMLRILVIQDRMGLYGTV